MNSIHAENLRQYLATEEARRNLSPEELAALQKMVERIESGDLPQAVLVNEDKFDASGMVPENAPGPPWQKK
jgi:hypothetical protein